MRNKKVWVWIAAIVAVVLILIVAFVIIRHRVAAPEVQAPVSDGIKETNALSSNEDPSFGQTGEETVSAPPKPLAYQDALNLYGSNRIQFDGVCQATPNNSTFKNNTDLMLDNRSPLLRRLHLGDMRDVSVRPWGFSIVTFSSDALPKTIMIDCDGSQNVATVLLQK